MNQQNKKSAKERLISMIFKHLHALPYYEIKRSIILVSYTEDHSFVFQKITNRVRQSTDKQPYVAKLQDNTRLIDPTTAFLKPEFLNPDVDLNFVTMHYVMNLVQEAKFIFIFNSADTSSMPFKIIKQTFTRFVSMFRPLQPEYLDQLISSCGIIINDARTDSEVETYCQRLQGIGEEGFLEKKYENVKKLAKNILDSQRILLCFQGKKSEISQKDFFQFTSKLSFFKMQGNVELNLTSNYKQFIKEQIYRVWDQIFKTLYSNIDTIIMGKGPQIQKQIYDRIRNYDKKSRDIQQKKKVQHSNKSFQSLHIMRTLDTMVQMIIKFSNGEAAYQINLVQNKQFLAQFLQFLYSQKLIQNLFIGQFLMAYFVIHKILSKKNKMDDPYADLFHRINFCQKIRNTETFNPKMRAISIELLHQLQKDLAENNKNYPFQQSLNLLNGLLKYKEQPLFSFFTDRIYKKLLKERANIAYNLIQRSSKNKKLFLQNSLNFIRWSAQSKLIKDKLKIQVLINIALELAQSQSTLQLALAIINLLPEYEVCRHVRYIYQKQLSINVQLLQYLSKEKRRDTLSRHFQNYYNFLMRVGFDQTVRQLSMQCLRLAETEEQRTIFKNALLKARGNTLRDLHKNFLQSTIQEEKEVIIPLQFIQNIEQQMVRNRLIEK